MCRIAVILWFVMVIAMAKYRVIIGRERVELCDTLEQAMQAGGIARQAGDEVRLQQFDGISRQPVVMWQPIKAIKMQWKGEIICTK